MAKSKIPGFRQASPKEVRELLKLAWVRDEELSDNARLLPDGRVLFYYGESSRAPLYPSRAAALEMKRRGEETAREIAEQEAKGIVHPCQTLLPPIDDFIRDVEAHAKSLGPRLRIPDEVLDGTPESLDAVDKALKRIPWAKRQVPDLVTPLVAYLGEVMRKGSHGWWTKAPTTRGRRVPVYDPADFDPWSAAYYAVSVAANEAAEKAGAKAKARRASKSDVTSAINAARSAAYDEINRTKPKPIRFEVIEEPVRGNENEPMIAASGGRLFQPFASVFIPMIEPSKRIPLRSAFGVPYIIPDHVQPPSR